MGNWHMSIEGTGPHHNPDHAADADKKLEQFVRELKRDHSIERALLTAGQRTVVVADNKPIYVYWRPHEL
jgi:hypothetical protein